MPDSEKLTERPSPVEMDIIRSFGWSIIQTELILYERYVRLSSFRSLTTIEGFKKHLAEMVSKGFIATETLHGQRAYRRLISDGYLHESFSPKLPLDEMRLAIGSREAQRKESKIRKWLGGRAAPGD